MNMKKEIWILAGFIVWLAIICVCIAGFISHYNF